MSRVEKLERVAQAARDWLEWENAGCQNVERLPPEILERRLAELDAPVTLAYREWWEQPAALQPTTQGGTQ